MADMYIGGSSSFNEANPSMGAIGNKTGTTQNNQWQNWLDAYKNNLGSTLVKKNPSQYRLNDLGQLQQFTYGGGDNGGGSGWTNYTPGKTDRVDVGNGLMMGSGSVINGKWQTGGYHTQKDMGGGNYLMTSYDDNGNEIGSYYNNPAATRASGGFMGKYGETLALGALAAMGGAAMMGPGAGAGAATSGGGTGAGLGSSVAEGALGSLGGGAMGTAGASAGSALAPTLASLGAGAAASGGGSSNWSSLVKSLLSGGQGNSSTGGMLSMLANMYSQSQARGDYKDILNQVQPYLEKLQQSYADPSSYYNSSEGQAISDLVTNKLGRSDAAAGRNANNIGRAKELQDYMLASLGQYRQGLSQNINSIYGGMGASSGLVGDIQGSNPLNSLFYNKDLWDYIQKNAGSWYDTAADWLGGL